MVKGGAPPPVSWPPPPPPGPPSDAGRRRVLVLALGVIVLLVAAGVGGYLLLRSDGQPTASVTDAVTSGAAADPSGSTGSAGGSGTTTRSPAAGGPVAGGAGPAGPSTTTARSTAPSRTPTTPFVPVPTGATADCSAPDGVDAANVTQSYEPAKAFDGKKETAWRCSGDAAGKTLVIKFAGPVQLTSVGLIPGYDKIDPTDAADRFVQSRKILRVKWTFDDGTSVESTPNGQRGMQTTPVSVRTGTVRMTIEQTTPGSTITNNRGESLAALDTTAVSEIAFAGLQ